MTVERSFADLLVELSRAAETGDLALLRGTLRALTVRQPYATAFLAEDEPKGVENRRQNASWRGLLAIHAGSAWFDGPDDRAVRAYYATDPRYAAFGVVVALGRLADAHRYAPGCCSDSWAVRETGAWHWAITDVHRLREPVAASGSQGLWIPGLELAAAILEQVADDPAPRAEPASVPVVQAAYGAFAGHLPVVAGTGVAS